MLAEEKIALSAQQVHGRCTTREPASPSGGPFVATRALTVWSGVYGPTVELESIFILYFLENIALAEERV